jgi:hypothetical protein
MSHRNQYVNVVPKFNLKIGFVLLAWTHLSIQVRCLALHFETNGQKPKPRTVQFYIRVVPIPAPIYGK